MISVIVPVYNEESAVADTLSDINKVMKSFKEYEIIVVNDGSTDKTLEKIKKLQIENLSIINHVENLGYGKSLFDGILTTKYNCIAIIDGDGSYPVDEIRELYKFFPQYDMVIGARMGKEYHKGITKKFARKLFHFLVEYATGRKIPDVNSGFRMFKKNIVIKFQDSLCTGFSFTTTLTMLFLLNHYYVKYVPIDYFKRQGKSKVSHFKDTFRAGQIIIETFLHYNPTKLFLLFATWNFIFGIFLGFLNHFIFKINFLSVLSAICIASFIPIFCMGLIAVQFKKNYYIEKEQNR